MDTGRVYRRTTLLGSLLAAVLATASCLAQEGGRAPAPRKAIRGKIGANSNKVKVEDGKTFIWAGPPRTDPMDSGAKWYDFTGSPIPAEELQFGIGMDAIPAIDDPYFVSPDDPRLLAIGRSPYRRGFSPKTNDEIPVIGYALGDDVRAYPEALLDRHELVNDRINGKPVTVGW